ncbi:hypothetical protein A0126_05930 [Exiguobacterium sp. N4-1P]|nr:hypothetical protein A0126_05930 [Exiguobacterium sp. N4-1P]
MHPFLKGILAVDNVRLGDQASFFVAFPGRGASRLESLRTAKSNRSRLCSFAVVVRKIAALKTRRDKAARTDCLFL